MVINDYNSELNSHESVVRNSVAICSVETSNITTFEFDYTKVYLYLFKSPRKSCVYCMMQQN